MIEKMTRYGFILCSGDRDAFIASLKELGVVDIRRSAAAVDEESEAMIADIEASRALVKRLENGTDEKLSVLRSEKNDLELELKDISVWGDYDREKLEAAAGRTRFYRVQIKAFKQEWENDYPLFVIENDSRNVWFVLLGDDEFPEKEIARPEHSVSELEALISGKDAEISARLEEIEEQKKGLPALKDELAAKMERLNLYLAGKAGAEAADGTLAVYEGFAPTKEDSVLKEAFDRMDCYWTSEAATLEDEPPISLKNNWFTKMFQPLTDMYGRPAYDGFDPTPYISIFFLLFFAMCMGDLGYGLILIIAGLFLRKSASFRDLAPLVTTLGIGTVVVGFFFHTFFSVDFSEWSIIPGWMKSIMVPKELAGYDGTMILSLIVGIIHLCLAMIVKTVYATRNKGFLNSLGVWGWTLLIVGGVVVALISLAGVIDKSVTKIIVIALGSLSALGIFLFNDLGRNPLANIGSGLWETYNTATGLLGDVLSYLRLYALGLAGAMLGYAFNILAGMALGDGGIGWIPFVLIVIIGHTLNLAMAALGAFVHPLRLNFLEFFKNSGYEGSGRKYNPIK